MGGLTATFVWTPFPLALEPPTTEAAVKKIRQHFGNGRALEGTSGGSRPKELGPPKEV